MAEGEIASPAGPEMAGDESWRRAAGHPVRWCAVPVFLLTLAAGLAVAPYLSFSPSFYLLPFLTAALWLPWRSRRLAPLLLPLLFLSLGIALYFLHVIPPDDPGHVRAFRSERPVIVEGIVESVQPRTLGRWSADLEATSIGANGIFAPVRGRVRLTIEEGTPDFRPGDRIRFRSRLQSPRSFGTPGEFDYPRHLAFQGVFATAFVPAAPDIAVFPAADSRWSLQDWRRRIGTAIDRAVPAEAPLVRALVIGDQGKVETDLRRLLSRCGLSHLFSISGLHLGLIALFLFHLLRLPYRRSERLLLFAPPRRILPLILLPFLFVYLLLTGDALPTRRAFLMLAAAAGLFLAARRTPPLKMLATAAFLLLLLEPLALFEPSFQLSFTGVLGLMVFLPRCQERLRAAARPLRWAGLLLATTLAASLATAPVVLLHFHLLAPAGLLANLVAVPVVSLISTPLGLLGALALPCWPSAADFFFFTCGETVRIVLLLVAPLLDIPGFGGWMLYLIPSQLAATFFITAALLFRFRRPGGRAVRLVLLATGVLLAFWSPPESGELRVVSLSVGQGDATLLSLPGGRHFLVDGGGLHSPAFDVGERLVAPALGRLGVRTLEAVILTHDHPDHRKGLVHVLEHFPARAFWTAVPVEKLDSSLQQVLRRRQTPVRLLPQGWTDVKDEENLHLRLFVPPAAPGNPNDASIVVHARLGKDTVLLTGDLEEGGVASLAAALPEERGVLLKLPHHGSRRSRPRLLLDRCRPEAVFVSVGAGNSYRFPHAEVVTELAARGIPLFRTDMDGTARFRTAGCGWRAERWRRGLFR